MEIREHLKNNKIKFKEFKHPAVFTCEQAEKYNQEIKGPHCKNLFLKNKKSNKFYLVITLANKKLEIKRLSELNEEKLTFANEKDLKELLNLTPGSVSPFGLINDKANKVIILIDKEVLEADYVSFHPNINTETLELTKENFHKYINLLNNKLIIF